MSGSAARITEGMRHICADFSQVICLRGFLPTKARTRVRINDVSAESIYFHRLGSSYGSSRTASVDIRVMLSIRILNAPIAGGAIGIISDHARRKTGYAYHHRFNAETGSTYNRCLEELGFYMTEVAEPWFSEWRDPQRLMTHDELSIEVREGLAAAISGNASPGTVAASLKALGIKARN